MPAPALVWFRQDLRLDDQPALRAAVDRGGPVIPIFLFAPDEEGDWPPGGATRWWLHRSLTSLEADLRRIGSRLVIRRGESLRGLRGLCRETGADAVYWCRRYEPSAVRRDAQIKQSLREAGLTAESFNGSLLHEPWTIQTAGGTPFKVFTPFWRKCLSGGEPEEPMDPPRRLAAPAAWPDSLGLSPLQLAPRIAWDAGLQAAWTPGEAGAHELLRRFLPEKAAAYAGERDRPDRAGTSQLSPHLHFGEISPRRVWQVVQQSIAPGSGREEGVAEPYLRQLVWREFAFHLLFHFPHTPAEPLRPEFAAFPWLGDEAQALRAWQRGATGYPYIDAGMRQLWGSGWMHNRVRMAVASFLVKDLLIDWREGARWFWDTLVDADLANNTLGWQWTAGCGADAAPYFRVFNPVGQGKKFDPQGDYVRRWAPELARLPAEHIHEPWQAPRDVLREAGVELGITYPHPLVDHADARVRALAALDRMKQQAGG